MAAPLPWMQRKWTFTYAVGFHPDIIERLRGVPARIEDLTRSWPAEVLIRRSGETWSIQENIGHLLDLEGLLDARIDDFLAGRDVLRAADMTNRATHEAGFNSRPITGLLADLRRERVRLVSRLDALAESDFARTALHPRLQTPMRLLDACQFAADHDDYHIARMVELARLFGAMANPRR